MRGVGGRSGRVVKARNALISAFLAGAAIAVWAVDSPQTLREAAEKHHLLMGSAADSRFLSDAMYAQILAREYSQLEPENEMKFGPIHPEPDTYKFADPDKLVEFAQAHGMKVRGHTLVWQSQVPDWVTDPKTPWTPEALNKVLADHIATVVGRYSGKVYAWDVVNEPFNDDGSMRNSVWYNGPGIGFAGKGTKLIEQALKWAHAADPQAKLFVNEFGAEMLNGKSNALYAMAKDFVKRGIPLSGIGFQLHVGDSFDSFDALSSFRANIKRFAALGLEVQFTEVDVRENNAGRANMSAQAETYKDLLSECLRQPACTAFQTWGFTDKHSWIPAENPGYGWALPFDANYKKKRAYDAMMKKLKSKAHAGPRPPTTR
jgi:endo-1,4-beta-xylanase